MLTREIDSFTEQEFASLFSESTNSKENAIHSVGYKAGKVSLKRILGNENQRLELIGKLGYTGYVKHLLGHKSGIKALLIDDGIDCGLNQEFPFTFPNSKYQEQLYFFRIARIESMIESVLVSLSGMDTAHSDLLTTFTGLFKQQMDAPEIVGFKCAAAYRCGLNKLLVNFDLDNVKASLTHNVEHAKCFNAIRVADASLISYCLSLVLSRTTPIPVQFHTGFGDNDLNSLENASPQHLIPFFQKFPNVSFVLLHASYPFSKEAGYLASVYPNVYVDIGLSIPLLSPHGQKVVLNELLHLAPLNRILYSSDGHTRPEMMAIAAYQAKHHIKEIFHDLIKEGILESKESEEYQVMMFGATAIQLYNLNISIEVKDKENVDPTSLLNLITRNIKHVRVCWLDTSNLFRCRIVPFHRFKENDFQVHLTNAVQSMPCMYDMAMDSPVGEVQLVPDHTSLIELPWMTGTAIVFGYMFKEGKPWALCPRTFLQRQESLLYNTFGLKMNVGFEIEFILFKKNTKNGTLEPIDTTVYCEMKSMSGLGWTVLEKIVDSLKVLGIPLWQYHSESARGQFEIAIGPFFGNIVAAADILTLTRFVIYDVAKSFNLHATMIPKPFATEAGNSNHYHMSLYEGGYDAKLNSEIASQAIMRQFVAGILNRLPSLSLISIPTVSGYARLQPQSWAGAFCCFGYQNREAPIRLISSSTSSFERFELKMIDGTSNPYLVLGSFIAAGMDGIKACLELPQPIQVDPFTLPLQEQPKRLPRSLSESINAFKIDLEFWNQVLGHELTDLLCRLRGAENDYYSNMTESELFDSLSFRY